MTKRKTIRKKFFIAALVLAIVIVALGYSGFRGVYAFRDLAVSLSQRASEFPVTAELTRAVDDLRFAFYQSHQEGSSTSVTSVLDQQNRWVQQQRYRDQLRLVREILARYKTRLENASNQDMLLSDRSGERQMVREIDRLLMDIAKRSESDEVTPDHMHLTLQQLDLNQLSELTHRLPTFLQSRMVSFRDEVRLQYRTWIALTWGSSLFSLVLLLGLWYYARNAIVFPFKNLLSGARRVASGDFEHRIVVESEDELSELAVAINRGTEGFLAIQSNLNEQVRARSQEVIRNEQLASVGFLAAGVAHEINNPLASIAWSAEALESRLHRILHSVESPSQASPENPDLQTLKTYLRRIQDDAFRCKGITERLLDFSRLGQTEKKQMTDLSELVTDVIDMVHHLGQYRNRRIEFDPLPDAFVWASPQEMKQVILNLLTNALDSLGDDLEQSRVWIRLSNHGEMMKLVLEDNGCGMTPEVKQHLFEPFFTRRRDGRGTGLGLPITSRIIADHGGSITPHSDGVGRGSRFEVLLPTRKPIERHERQLKAA